MEKHRNFFKDEYGKEANFMHLDIFGKNSSQIKRNRVLQLISISLFTLSVILSVKLLINLLFPRIAPGYNEITIMISSCFAVTLAASLISYKYQSLLEILEYRLGIKVNNLNNVIKQFKIEKEDQRHCANDLSVAKEKYRCLVENVSEGILLLDTEGNFLEANKKMETLLGFSEAELLTMNLTQLFPKEELERSQAILEKVIHTGESDLANGWIIRKDEQRVPVNFVASKVKYGNQTIIQGIFRDLTERWKPEPIQSASGKN
ncbi:MAG: PAS domain S-box protein [Desulfobaccales bacterium]